jgi:hypothetical protein
VIVSENDMPVGFAVERNEKATKARREEIAQNKD